MKIHVILAILAIVMGVAGIGLSIIETTPDDSGAVEMSNAD